MELLKQAGGNCVATYIPWMLHEPEEGKLEFENSSLTDFPGFLNAASDAGLFVIARPGPYQYSELKFSGLPAWLFRKYPEVRARRADGSDFGYQDSISYVHPVFLEKVRNWFDAICPLIARSTVSRGGPIALTQVDNELTGIHLWFDGPDFHPESMGFGMPGGRYAKFLRKKFKNVAEMNSEYGTRFESFTSVRPRGVPLECRAGQSQSTTRAAPATSQFAEQRRKQDYFDFYLETVAEYAGTLAGWMREYGIDTPLTLNSGPNMTPILVDAVKAVGGNVLLGSDHYYTLDQTWLQNNPTPQFAAMNFCSLESLRLLGFPPTVFEMQAGSSADWPPITAQDARTHYWTNLAFGMKGLNYYVFTGGPNPPGAGTTGESYDYGAAIGGVNGEIRPLYGIEKELGEFLEANDWLCKAQRETDCRIAFDFSYARAEYTFKDRGELPISDFDAFEFFRRGILTSALCASLSPALCDLDSDDWVTDTGTPVIMVSSASMSRAKQLRISRFLQGGGRMLLAPVIPILDDRFHSCTILADFLGLKEPRTSIRPDGTYQMLPSSPPKAREMPCSDTGNKPWMIEWSGGGRFIFLGKRWNHSMHTQGAMMQDLLRPIGLSQRVFCSSPYLWTSLRSNGSNSILFVMNLFTSDLSAEIRCLPMRGGEMTIAMQSFPAMTVKHFIFKEGRSG